MSWKMYLHIFCACFQIETCCFVCVCSDTAFEVQAWNAGQSRGNSNTATTNCCASGRMASSPKRTSKENAGSRTLRVGGLGSLHKQPGWWPIRAEMISFLGKARACSGLRIAPGGTDFGPDPRNPLCRPHRSSTHPLNRLVARTRDARVFFVLYIDFFVFC